MPGKLELRFEVGSILDRDSFTDNRHFFPAIGVAIARGVFRVGLIDIQVFLVGRKDGQAPGAEIVVPDGNARKGGLASADDIPTRGGKMNPITERRDL